jgi:protoporphyrinogen oxidase
VLERRSRAGGRIASEWIDGFCLDAALESVSTRDRHLMGWISELGLADRLLPLRPAQLTQLHRGRVTAIDPQRLGGVAAMPGVTRRDALKLIRWRRLFARYRPFLDPTAPERAADLDYRSAADFGRLYFGESCFERWISPEGTSVYGGDAEQLSRVATLLHWERVGLGQDRPAIAGIVRSGLQTLVQELAGRLDVRKGVEVTRVDENAAGGFSLECGTRDGRKGVLEADAVVLATDAATSVRLTGATLQPAERDTLSGMQYGPSLTLAVAVSRPLSGLPELVRLPHCEQHVADVALVEPGIADGRAPVGGSLVTLRAGDRFAEANVGAADDVIEKGLLDGLTRLCPDAAGHVLHTRLTRRSAATPRFEVGAYRALARFARVQADRRALGRALYFAGDQFVGPDAEAQTVSGFRAAQDLLGDLRCRAGRG